MLARSMTLLRRILCHVANNHAPLAIGILILGSIVNDLASEPLAIVDDITALHDTLASIMTSSSPSAILEHALALPHRMDNALQETQILLY